MIHYFSLPYKDIQYKEYLPDSHGVAFYLKRDGEFRVEILMAAPWYVEDTFKMNSESWTESTDSSGTKYVIVKRRIGENNAAKEKTESRNRKA